MAKKLRSARFSVPGPNASVSRSTSACSLTADESTAAARTRRVPHEARVTSRACGKRPPLGIANRAAISAVAARSTTVPSNTVNSSPNQVAPGTSASSPAPAVAWNNASNGSPRSRVRAWDNAEPLGTAAPGVNAPGSSASTRASTAS